MDHIYTGNIRKLISYIKNWDKRKQEVFPNNCIILCLLNEGLSSVPSYIISNEQRRAWSEGYGHQVRKSDKLSVHAHYMYSR